MPTLRHLVLTASLLACHSFPCSAAGLLPEAGDRVARSAAMVAAEIQDAIVNDTSDAAADLRRFVDTDDAFRVYHRDHQVLVAMSTKRNISFADKRIGEQEAAELTRNVLQQKFSHLLESEETGFEGLAADSVRVVFIEPDAFDSCPGRRPSHGGGGSNWQAPIPFAGNGLWSSGWATPTPCTGCQ
jgi:hypothetical protein